MWVGNFYYIIPTGFPSLSVTSFYYVIFVVLAMILARSFNGLLKCYILFAANIIFAYSFGKNALLVLICISLLTYIFGMLLNNYRAKAILFIEIGFLVAILSLFKYTNVLSFVTPVMPIGISFYSFKAISYLADIYKDKVKVEKNLLYFMDYLMFFPCVTAGPINRAKQFFEELKTKSEFKYKEYAQGISGVLFGIFEKIVVCDFIGNFASRILGNEEMVGKYVILGLVLYSFQIYLDFDSYSNIAIGTAKMLGFNLPRNFNSPYLATSLKEFWNRWHISLSSWLKDYIYIPLGGSKKGLLKKYLNIIIVFVVSGIWHGNTFNFLLWGLLHGLIRVIQDAVSAKINIKNKYVKLVLTPFGILLNFTIVTFTWLVFKYQNLNDLISVVQRIFIGNGLGLEYLGITILEIKWLIVLLIGVSIMDLIRNNSDIFAVFSKLPFFIRWIIYIGMIFVFLVFGQYGSSVDANDFIYRWF